MMMSFQIKDACNIRVAENLPALTASQRSEQELCWLPGWSWHDAALCPLLLWARNELWCFLWNCLKSCRGCSNMGFMFIHIFSSSLSSQRSRKPQTIHFMALFPSVLSLISTCTLSPRTSEWQAFCCFLFVFLASDLLGPTQGQSSLRILYLLLVTVYFAYNLFLWDKTCSLD